MDGTYNDVGVGKTYYGIATSHGAARAPEAERRGIASMSLTGHERPCR
jgi:hypothetical protein